jgi:hypothetical protein
MAVCVKGFGCRPITGGAVTRLGYLGAMPLTAASSPFWPF